MEWMFLPLKRYAEFSGRSQRMEYWMYTLGIFIVTLVLSVIEGVAGIGGMVFRIYGPLSAILVVATFIPGLAVSVRRLHDTDHSGWWLLSVFGAYCIVGFGAATGIFALTAIGGILALVLVIVLFVFLVSNGTQGSNRFGPDPKNPAANADVFA